MNILINVTSHVQDNLQWGEHSADPVIFANDGDPCGIQIDPDRPLHPQVMQQWKQVLQQIDNAYQAGYAVNGLMVAGYAPAVLGIVKQARDFRLPCYVSVMKPAPAVEGQKRAFVPSGVRWCRPAPFRVDAPNRPKGQNGNGPEHLIHFAPRPLDETRRALIESLGCSIARSEQMFPPPRNGDAVAEIRATEDAVAKALKGANGVLLDGPPIETAICVWNICRNLGLPIYFLKTQPAPPPLFANPVSVERLPY